MPYMSAYPYSHNFYPFCLAKIVYFIFSFQSRWKREREADVYVIWTTFSIPSDKVALLKGKQTEPDLCLFEVAAVMFWRVTRPVRDLGTRLLSASSLAQKTCFSREKLERVVANPTSAAML